MDEEHSPQPITLPIARAYRDYIASKWNGAHILSLIAGLLPATVLLADTAKLARFAIWHLFSIPIAIYTWLRELRQPWEYKVDERGLSLFGLSKSEKSRYRCWLRWDKEIIVSTELGQWRHLPSLQIYAISEYESVHDLTLRIVCEPSDEEILRQSIIPAIEYYRKKHFHDFWIEQHLIKAPTPAEKA